MWSIYNESLLGDVVFLTMLALYAVLDVHSGEGGGVWEGGGTENLGSACADRYTFSFADTLSNSQPQPDHEKEHHTNTPVCHSMRSH